MFLRSSTVSSLRANIPSLAVASFHRFRKAVKRRSEAMRRMKENNFYSFQGATRQPEITAALPPDEERKLKLLIQNVTLVNGGITEMW